MAAYTTKGSIQNVKILVVAVRSIGLSNQEHFYLTKKSLNLFACNQNDRNRTTVYLFPIVQHKSDMKNSAELIALSLSAIFVAGAVTCACIVSRYAQAFEATGKEDRLLLSCTQAFRQAKRIEYPAQPFLHCAIPGL